MNRTIDAALLIHYYFPPIHSIGVIRNYNFAKVFHNHFQHIKLLTTSNRNILPSDTKDGIDKMDIVELQTKDYRSKKSNEVHFKEETKQKPLMKLARKLIDSYPFNIWIGEGGSRYISNGIKEGEKFLSKHPNAMIYTSFRPYADLYIGYKLKEKFPNSNWVVDFRDLHVDPMYKNVLFPNYQHKINKRFLSKANLVTTVSEGLKTKLDSYHNKVRVTYNGFDSIKHNIVKYEKFTISYTGSMFGESRDPSIFFDWLKKKVDQKIISILDLEIKYAGKDSSKFHNYIQKFKLEKCFTNLGMISNKEAKKLQSKSHVNLLLTTVTKDHKGILTGKLFEYLGSLTPILAVIKGGEDQELNGLLSDTKSGIVFSENKIQEEEFISWYNLWLGGSLVKTDPSTLQNILSWENSALSIIEALENEA